MKSYIPNAITLLNLFFGCLAAIFAATGELETAAFLVFAGIICDFLDGLAARLLDAKSDLGIQLDSLADMVTCGVVPGIVMFQLLHIAAGDMLVLEYGTDWGDEGFRLEVIPLAGFLITMASAYRLAKFNIDEDQVDAFIGLPTPANTLFILSFPLILAYQNNDTMNSVILNPWFLLLVVLASVVMMNARVKLFALKFKTWSFKDNAVQHIFLLLSLVLLIVLWFAAIPLIIILYILLSLAQRQLRKEKVTETR